MKKVFRYIAGSICLILYFFVIDDTGIGMKKRWKRVQAWANE